MGGKYTSASMWGWTSTKPGSVKSAGSFWSKSNKPKVVRKPKKSKYYDEDFGDFEAFQPYMKVSSKKPRKTRSELLEAVAPRALVWTDEGDEGIRTDSAEGLIAVFPSGDGAVLVEVTRGDLSCPACGKTVDEAWAQALINIDTLERLTAEVASI